MNVTKYRVYYAPCQYIEEYSLYHAIESRDDYQDFTPDFCPYIAIVVNDNEYVLR